MNDLSLLVIALGLAATVGAGAVFWIVTSIKRGRSGDSIDKVSLRMLTERVKDIVGVSAEIAVADPGGVARSEGKAKRVVDHRPKE